MNIKRAFTLIELLVVIAIIAILAAILFPVFAQAKAAAKKTQSLSNLKQTGTAIQIYMGDSDDVYPRGCGGGWYFPMDGGWAWDTQPYIKNYPMLLDPSDTKPKRFWPTWFPGQPVVSISYASNGIIVWDGSANVVGGLMGLDQSAAGCASGRCGAWMGRGTTSASMVTYPSDTVMLATRYDGNNLWSPGADVVSGVNWWDWSGPGLHPDGSRNGAVYQAPAVSGGAVTVNTNNRFGAIAAVYANNGIFAMADTSAKAMNPVATNPNGSTQPQLNKWNALRP